MDYEKAYKDALEIARDYYKANLMLDKADENLVLEDIFPELKESEDEETKKSLMQYIWNIYHREYCPPTPSIETCDKWLAWLEKQAERKTPQWMIDFLDNYRRKIGCSLDYDEARDVDGKILCIKDWLEKQGEQNPAWSEEDERLYQSIIDDTVQENQLDRCR